MSCAVPADLYCLETVVPTERQQRLQVCKNSSVRRIARVKRVDELREEISVQMRLAARLVKYLLRWAGHLAWIREERMANTADRLREQERRKRGTPQLRWEDARRDIHKVRSRLGPYSVQSVGAASAVSLAIGHNPGRVATPTQYTSMLALILPTSEG